MEKFIFGVALGGLAGALLTANNYKMRTIVKKSQEEVQAKLDKLMDEKIESLEKGAKNVKEKIEEGVKELTEKKSKPSRKSKKESSSHTCPRARALRRTARRRTSGNFRGCPSRSAH